MSALSTYEKKRDFKVTPEPASGAPTREGRSFVVQKHAAHRLHYDFRLELDGVLKSWAIPKGPSLSPKEKRLAVEVEDHPIDYRDFEGTIPRGQYGGGEVIVWDRGLWKPTGDPVEGLRKGHLRFTLEGERLHGDFSLVRLRARDDEKRTNWLLLKSSDEHAKQGAAAEVTARQTSSVLSGRTLADVARGVPSRAKRAKGAKAKRPSRAAAKKTAPLPASPEPELATLVSEVPTGPDWLFEVKLDGYRALARIEGGVARLTSRNGKDWSKTFSVVTNALGGLRVRDAILDGEVCVVDAQGKTSFEGLQGALSGKNQEGLVYFVFDVLYRDGEDLRALPLRERKHVLATLLAGERPPLKLCEHLEGDGAKVFAEACKLGLEGVMAKRASSTYQSGRGRAWLKIKCARRQEMVIVGFTAPEGARSGLGALVLGVRDGAKSALKYAGKVGTGFSEKTLADLHRRLKPLVRATPPVEGAPRLRGVTWVTPELVCEVRFTEWTKTGALRHPTFLGLREDKPAKSVVREREQATPPPPEADAEALVLRGVTITHPDRVLDEASKVTKGALASYYDAVVDWMLPYAKSRPLSLLRCPSGRQSECFFQKHVMVGMGASIHAGKAGDQEVLSITTARGLLELAQFGVVEIHGWGSRSSAPDKPDWLVLDLDPDESLPWRRVVLAAEEAREALRSVGLESWVKTTGGKGLHVVAPFRPKSGWDTVKRFAHALANDFVRRAPDEYTSKLSKSARSKKILIDYLRNAEGATAVLPYSARAREGMTVAMPVSWKDLGSIHPKELTVETVPGLLARRKADPWAGFLKSTQRLPAKLDELLADAAAASG